MERRKAAVKKRKKRFSECSNAADGKRRGREHKVFLFAFGLSLCVLILGLGVATVDYQGRRLSFGDETPVFRVENYEDGTSRLRVKLLGLERTIPFTVFSEMWNFICEFSCIPHG